MSYEFSPPNLTGQTPQAQLRQLGSYLRQHVEQLNWVLRNLTTTRDTALTQAQREEACDAVSQSETVFQTLCRRLRKKQAQENFLCAGKRTILEGGSWAQGDVITGLEGAVLNRYTVFTAVCGGAGIVCAKQGDAITAPGLRLTLAGGTLTVTAAETPMTALYAVI